MQTQQIAAGSKPVPQTQMVPASAPSGRRASSAPAPLHAAKRAERLGQVEAKLDSLTDVIAGICSAISDLGRNAARQLSTAAQPALHSSAQAEAPSGGRNLEEAGRVIFGLASELGRQFQTVCDRSAEFAKLSAERQAMLTAQQATLLSLPTGPSSPAANIAQDKPTMEEKMAVAKDAFDQLSAGSGTAPEQKCAEAGMGRSRRARARQAKQKAQQALKERAAFLPVANARIAALEKKLKQLVDEDRKREAEAEELYERVMGQKEFGRAKQLAAVGVHDDETADALDVLLERNLDERALGINTVLEELAELRGKRDFILAEQGAALPEGGPSKQPA
ncbi:hypothetical protein [Martelella sp. HB161492]|uniref:hypothetical protein n=1 Tax=Martelella sp. HB161492 TaxID=2720726 RepID=UPI00158FF3D3|nr:hypothetical protein [Martelella sp. HB161492]